VKTCHVEEPATEGRSLSFIPILVPVLNQNVLITAEKIVYIQELLRTFFFYDLFKQNVIIGNINLINWLHDQNTYIAFKIV
jgi:hypothetical protein